MSNNELEGCLTMGLALLLMGANVPLILRKVPMNPIYGFRLPEAFKSEKNWYDINARGAKVLFWSCLPILALGLFKFLVHDRSRFWYFDVIVYASPAFSCLYACRAARKIDQENR